MSRVTTKNLKIGLWGLFEKKRFLYFHLMAQMQIFGSKMQFFGPKSIFFRNHPFFWHHHDWTPKRQLFCVDPDARRALGRPRRPILITHLILISDLRMLYPTWRIFYQFGESHLNVFWHHILENPLSVDIFERLGIIFYQMLKDHSGP